MVLAANSEERLLYGLRSNKPKGRPCAGRKSKADRVLRLRRCIQVGEGCAVLVREKTWNSGLPRVPLCYNYWIVPF